jgi:hypothetical protein
VAIQSLLKAGFPRAVQVELVVITRLQRDSVLPSFRTFAIRLEIFFRNLLWWASLKEHAIVCGPEQQLGCAGCFRITPWSVVLLFGSSCG